MKVQELHDSLPIPWTMFYQWNDQHELSQKVFAICYDSTEKNGCELWLTLGFKQSALVSSGDYTNYCPLDILKTTKIYSFIVLEH